MDKIDWNQKRRVLKNVDGEVFVEVETGFMMLEDYTEGGPSVPKTTALRDSLELIGVFTNAEIDNGKWEG